MVKNADLNNNKLRILLIITGSVAAYKAMDLIRLLRKDSFQISCILTKSACEFITPLLASTLSGSKSYHDLFSEEKEGKIDHISLARNCDLVLIAPATADFLAKFANGYADDLASTILLATDKPVMIAPAMNEKMWLNPATQANISTLKSRGVIFIDPQVAKLACGEFGIGKIAENEEIYQKILDFFAYRNSLFGKKILITGGATIEPIDPVRYISNYSSGKQSFYLVKHFLEMGAQVIFVAGKIEDRLQKELENFVKKFDENPSPDLLKNQNLKVIYALNAQDMMAAVKKNLTKLDVFIGCAAVCDFSVSQVFSEKIKKDQVLNDKSANKSKFLLELKLNPDILYEVAKAKNRPSLVVGFSAESKDLIKNATEKMIKKNCDLIVANNIKKFAIFGEDKTNITIIHKAKKPIIEEFGDISKSDFAKILAQKIAKKITNR